MSNSLEDRIASLEATNEKLERQLEKTKLDADTRAAALQYLVAQLFRQVYIIGNLDDATVKDNHAKAVALFKKYAHGGPDPAMSDHVSDEIAYWIEDTLNDAEDIRADYKRRGLPG